MALRSLHCRRPVETHGQPGKLEIDFRKRAPSAEASAIAVTKLSFPNLWNYIRLRYFRRSDALFHCSANMLRPYIRRRVVCFIVSELVLRSHVAARHTYMRKASVDNGDSKFTVGDNFTDAAGVKCFPFQWCEFIGKIISRPSTIHYRILSHRTLSFTTHKYRISNGDINLPHDGYHLSGSINYKNCN